MEEDELKGLWKNTPGKININSQQILDEMNLEIAKMETSIKRRNMREIIAAILVIIFFSIQAYRFESWIESLASILIVLAAVFIIVKLMITQNAQKRADISTSIKEQMVSDREYLKKEQKLLKNVLYWYILPIFIPIIMISCANGISWFTGFIYIPLVTIFFIGIYYANQKAAEKFDPILDNLNKSIKEMEG